MPTASRIESVEVALVVSPKRPRPVAVVAAEESSDGGAGGSPSSHCSSPADHCVADDGDSVQASDGSSISPLTQDLYFDHTDALQQWAALIEWEGAAAYAVSELPTAYAEGRQTIVTWQYSVLDHYNLDRVCAAVAMAHFDRLVCHGLVARGEWHLAAATCLYAAVKAHSLMMPGLSLRTMVKLLRGICGEEAFVDMEHHICNALDWRMNPPVAAQFVDILRPMLVGEPMSDHDFDLDDDIVIDDEARHKLIEKALFLCELSVMDTELCATSPSSIAYGSLAVAMDVLRFPAQASQWLSSLDIDYDPEETSVCTKRLRALLEAGGYEPELEDTPEHQHAKAEGKERPRAVTPNKGDVPPSVKRLRQEAIVDSPIDSCAGEREEAPTKKRRTV